MKNKINIPEYQVSQFNRILKEVVETNFDYVRIRGEISDLKKASSGHLYLTLKDNESVLNGTIWNNKKNYLLFKPEIGMEIIATGKISTYAKSISTYSINIDKIELAGEGALLKVIEERKKKLKEKGLFDEERKKSLPFLPQKIGVITSASGSVIHDIINRIKDRFPTNIDLWPVTVQGIEAANDIIQAIKGFNHEKYILKPDIIIIARGGGSTEDLMPFNDEKLALEVFNSKIPVISAIGHETDTCIIDFVSDVRASTPTAAAEKAVPVKIELEDTTSNLHKRLIKVFEKKLEINYFQLLNLSKFLKEPKIIFKAYNEKFNKFSKSLIKEFNLIYQNNVNNLSYFAKNLQYPKDLIETKKDSIKNLSKNLKNNINYNKNLQIKELNKFIRLLESNSLHSNLKKGYSIIRKSKKIIKKSNQILKDDKINVQLIDQSINLKIKKIN